MKKYILLIAILIIALTAVLVLVIKLFPQKNDHYAGAWEAYLNEKYGYNIDYPSFFRVFEDPSGDIVSFGDPPNPLTIGVFVTSSQYASVEDWLEANPSQRFEREIKASGYGGFVTHYISNEGDVTEDKTTVFIKDGKLFKIETSYTLHDRILNSFKFE